jgi:ectoine hydroxylase-related dioxygenase (phytanoyl-CoA dioxygenase family)
MTISNKGYVVIKNYLSDKEVSGIKESFIPELFEYPYSQESSPKVGYAEIDETRLLATAKELTGKDYRAWYKKVSIKAAYEGYQEPYHQDFFYRKDSGLSNDSYLQCFIALDDLKYSTLNVFEESHKLGLLDHIIGIERNGFSKFRIPASTLHSIQDKFTSLVLNKGDLVIFNYLLVHGSSSNSYPDNQYRAIIQLVEKDKEFNSVGKDFEYRRSVEISILSKMLQDKVNNNSIPRGIPNK